jgi:hypothetical protein
MFDQKLEDANRWVDDGWSCVCFVVRGVLFAGVVEGEGHVRML